MKKLKTGRKRSGDTSPRKVVALNTRLTQADGDLLDKLAKSTGMSKSEFVAHAIRMYAKMSGHGGKIIL